jgi:hypothetical protein
MTNDNRERLTTDKTKIFIRESITIMSVTKDELRRLYNEIFDRLQEYEVAEETGQIIVPPCKVGDKVFYVHEICDENGDEYLDISVGEVVSFSMQKEGLWAYCRYEDGLTYWHLVADDFGKTVFLTKEEALSKLQASCKQVKGGVEK